MNGNNNNYLSNISYDDDSVIDELITEPINEPIIESLTIYKCENCIFETSDLICLMDHNMIVHDGMFEDQYICDVCDMIFNSQYQLDLHIGLHDDNQNDNIVDNNDNESTPPPPPPDSYDSDNESYDSDYSDSNNNDTRTTISSVRSHICIICNRRFQTQFHLGEHFINTHQSYEEQMHLDRAILQSSFPGFEILSTINFIALSWTVTKKKEFIEILKNKCFICNNYFSLIKHNNNTKNIIMINDLDMNTIYNEMNNNKINFHDDFGIIYKKNIECCDNIRFPMTLLCCGNNLCHRCIKEYLMNNTTIKCPYCTKDHVNNNLDYIKTIEFEKSNRNSWINWWSKNDRVNLLAF